MKKGFGTIFKVTIDATVTEVPHVLSIKPGGFSNASMEAGEIDAAEESFEKTVVKRKPITLKINWNPADATHQFLYEAGAAGDDIVCSIVGADAGAETMTFTAWITDWDENDLGQTSKHEVTIQLQPKSGMTRAA